MKFSKILLIIGLVFLITSCTTTEKFSVYAPVGTKIYTPNSPYAPNGMATYSEKVKIEIPSDMYCAYILAQSGESTIKVPIGLDYKIDRHTRAKVPFYLIPIGVGVVAGGIAVKDEIILASGELLGLTGTGMLLCTQARFRQTSYDYNFAYEKNQRVKIPQLSYTLLNPNPPKEHKNETVEIKESSSRKKASSGKDVSQEKKSATSNSSKVNTSRLDNAKRIEGKYVGKGKLLSGNNIEENYSEIYLEVERIDKDHVSIRIIESDEDYFDAPLVYTLKKGKNSGYILNIDKLPEAVIQITYSGKLTFNHKKVNIDDVIYTLEITADKVK